MNLKDNILKNNRLALAMLIALAVVVIDQMIKFWVRNNIGDGPNIRVTDWFFLCFVENNGMAFGLTLGSKLFLSVFRIFAVFGLVYLVYYLDKKNYSLGFVIGFALIFAGALGNIIDCVFYATWFDGGKLLYGKVVDMFYFPLFKSTWPDWTPWAGHSLVFFRPVFNFADAAITSSVFYIILFKNKELTKLLGGSDNEDDGSKNNDDANGSDNGK